MESLKPSTKYFLLLKGNTGLNSGQLAAEASVVTFFDQLPVQTRGGNFQRVRKRNQIFNIEYRSYLLADQLAISMGNALGAVDENAQDRVLTCAFELRIDELISLAFNNILNERPKPVPFDSHTHDNKKVGKTPTQKSILKYRFSTALNQWVSCQDPATASPARLRWPPTSGAILALPPMRTCRGFDRLG